MFSSLNHYESLERVTYGTVGYTWSCTTSILTLTFVCVTADPLLVVTNTVVVWVPRSLDLRSLTATTPRLHKLEAKKATFKAGSVNCEGEGTRDMVWGDFETFKISN